MLVEPMARDQHLQWPRLVTDIHSQETEKQKKQDYHEKRLCGINIQLQDIHEPTKVKVIGVGVFLFPFL